MKSPLNVPKAVKKMLDKLEVVDKPAEINDKMNIELNPSVISGNDVLSVSHLSKAFDDNTLFTDHQL